METHRHEPAAAQHHADSTPSPSHATSSQERDELADHNTLGTLLLFGLAALVADIAVELEREIDHLHRRHAQVLRKFMIHLGVAPADAEELVVDAFVGVYRAMQRSGLLEKPKTYLYAVASNKMRAHWRRHYRRQAHAERVQQLDEADARLDSPDETARIDDRLAFQKALAGLPPRQREAFMFRFYCGFPPEEIATVMGITANTVDTHLQRARQKLSRLQHKGREAAS